MSVSKAKNDIKQNKLRLSIPTGYVVPEILRDLPEDEWAAILNFVADLLTKHNVNSLEITKGDVKKQLKDRYNSEIIALTSEKEHLESKIKTINKEMNEKIDALRVSMEEIHSKNIALIENNMASRIKIYEDEINYIKESYRNKTREAESEIHERVLGRFSAEIKSKENTIAKLEAEKVEVEARFKDQNASERKLLDNQIAQLQETIKNINADKVKSDSTIALLTSLQAAFVKPKNDNAVAIGMEGELKILSILSTDKYQDAIIEDVSGIANAGDLYFKWKKLACLIEVKNKKTITREDTDKFERNIIDSPLSKNKINCGIFISVGAGKVQKVSREPIQLDYITGIPVVYVNMNHEVFLHSAVCLLDKILSIDTSATEAIDDLKRDFVSYFKYLEGEYKYYETTIENKTRELNALRRKQDGIKQTYNNLKPDYYKYIDTDEAKRESTERKTETKTDAETKNESAGVLNEMSEEKKFKIMSTFIDNEVALKLFKLEDDLKKINTTPDRSHINGTKKEKNGTKLYKRIISEQNLRMICDKITGITKLVPFIYNYCNKTHKNPYKPSEVAPTEAPSAPAEAAE